jgi:hypothetical protein
MIEQAAPACPCFDDAALEADIRAEMAAEFGFAPDVSLEYTSVDAGFWQGSEPSDPGPAPVVEGWAWRYIDGEADVWLKVCGERFKITHDEYRAGFPLDTVSRVRIRLVRDDDDAKMLASTTGDTMLVAWHNAINSLIKPKRRLFPEISRALAGELRKRGAPL